MSAPELVGNEAVASGIAATMNVPWAYGLNGLTSGAAAVADADIASKVGTPLSAAPTSSASVGRGVVDIKMMSGVKLRFYGTAGGNVVVYGARPTQAIGGLPAAWILAPKGRITLTLGAQATGTAVPGGGSTVYWHDHAAFTSTGWLPDPPGAKVYPELSTEVNNMAREIGPFDVTGDWLLVVDMPSGVNVMVAGV